MATFDFKTATPSSSLGGTAFLFGADSQAAATPAIYTVAAVKTQLLGQFSLTAAQTYTFPTTSATLARTDAGQTFTGTNIFGITQATSLALGGATIGTNALAVTGAGVFSTTLGVTTGPVTISNFTIGSGSGYAYIDKDVTGSPQFGVSAAFVTAFKPIGLSSGYATTPDVLLSRAAAATLQHGAADVASGAVAQIVTFQGNTGSTTNGPLSIIRGAGGGSSTSVGGELRFIGGLSSAAAGTGGAITFYTAPAAAGNVGVLALTIDSTKLATFAGGVLSSSNVSIASGFGFQIYTSGSSGSAGFLTTSFGATNIVNLASTWNFGWSSGAATTTLDSNFSRISAGVIGVGTGAAASVAGTLSLTGLTMATAGKLSMASGTNQRAGNATLVGGTVTVSNTTVTANTVVMMSPKTAGGTLGTYTYTLSAGASFTINSSNVLDTSVVSYVLIEVP